MTMSFMIETYCPQPADEAQEAHFASIAKAIGGRLDFREVGEAQGSAVCLTFDFETLEKAESAADQFRRAGVHVEGPSDYGPEHHGG